jgi:hypothetical protein
LRLTDQLHRSLIMDVDAVQTDASGYNN